MIKISIVIPVYNSQGCLKELYRQTEEAVSVGHEVIFVNDQSSDNSWTVISALVKENKNVIGINFRKNSGQDNAIIAGLSRASGEYVAVMDDDLQHSPGDIQALYDKCRQGYDACYANFLKKEQRWFKNLGSWLNGKAAEVILGKPKELYLSPFKIIRGAVVKDMCEHSGPYPYIDGLILSITNNIAQIDVEHHRRYAGKSTYSLFKSIVVWGKHITGFSVAPLRLATFMGMFSALIGFLLGLYYIILYVATRNVVEGWTTLIVVNLFSGGLILMALGFVGEYVGRSYLLLNRKPQYTIKETIRYREFTGEGGVSASAREEGSRAIKNE